MDAREPSKLRPREVRVSGQSNGLGVGFGEAFRRVRQTLNADVGGAAARHSRRGSLPPDRRLPVAAIAKNFPPPSTVRDWFVRWHCSGVLTVCNSRSIKVQELASDEATGRRRSSQPEREER